MNTNTQRHICAAIFIVAFLNFVLFWLLAVYLGGDAINGKIQGDHFYLMAHGKFTEVSEAVSTSRLMPNLAPTVIASA